MDQHDRGTRLAVLRRDCFMIGEPNPMQGRRSRNAGLGQHAVENLKHPKRMREPRAHRNVLRERAQLRGGDAVVDSCPYMRRELRLRTASGGQDR